MIFIIILSRIVGTQMPKLSEPDFRRFGRQESQVDLYHDVNIVYNIKVILYVVQIRMDVLKNCKIHGIRL